MATHDHSTTRAAAAAEREARIIETLARGVLDVQPEDDERAVVAAEVEMKNAEDALAAMEHSVTDREKNIEALRTVCLQASPDRPAQAGRDAWERDRYIGICDVLIASHKAGRNLAVQDSGRFMELRQDELEEEAVWAEAFDDPSICWDLRNDDLEAQSDDMIDALASLLVPNCK